MLESLLLASNALTGAALGWSLNRLSRYQARLKQRGLFRRWPLPRVRLHDFDPVFTPDGLGPRPETEIRFIAAYHVQGGTSDLESWVLGVLAKRARCMFEFGTCTGKTTHLLAVNSPADARVHTLTLPPELEARYQAGSADDDEDTRIAREESVHDHFFYEKTDAAEKVVQHFGDSKTFDTGFLKGQCDLIFIDGSHAYSYVLSDSRKALAMVRPGGIILWHDYRGPRQTRGVYRALNELGRELPLQHLGGTSLVAYRAPESDHSANPSSTGTPS